MNKYRFWRLLRHEWRHPPNLVTLIRLVGSLTLLVMMVVELGITIPENNLATIFNHDGLLALAALLLQKGFWTTDLFAVTAATDKLDGFLAKRIFGKTELGAMLDPLVDKVLMLVSIIVGLVATAARQEIVVMEFLLGLGLFLVFRERDVFRLKKAAVRTEGTVSSARQSGRVSMVVFSIALSITLLPIVGPWISLLKISLLTTTALFSRRSWNDYSRAYGKYLVKNAK